MVPQLCSNFNIQSGFIKGENDEEEVVCNEKLRIMLDICK